MMRILSLAVFLIGTVALLPLQIAVAAPAVPSAVTVQSVELSTGTVRFRDSGGNETPVVFVGRNSSLLWDPQVAAVTGAGYRFIALESASPAEMMMKGQAIIDALTRHLGLARFFLVGISGGAPVSMQYALSHPDRIRGLMVGNSLMGLRDLAFNDMEDRLRPQGFDAMPRDFHELSPTYRALQPDGVARWLQLTEPATLPPGAAPAAPPGPPPITADSVTWSRLETFAVPTLVFTGDADLYTPPGIMRVFVARLKNAKSIVIPDAGHATNWENPQAFNTALLAFLRRH